MEQCRNIGKRRNRRSFFETWIVSEIYKSYLNTDQKPPLYFYRNSNKKEIDLIIYQDAAITPIEIKKSAAPKSAIKNFSVLSPIEPAPSEKDVFSGAAHLKQNQNKRRYLYVR